MLVLYGYIKVSFRPASWHWNIKCHLSHFSTLITLVENFETGDIVKALKALSVGARFLQSWVIDDHF